MSNAIAGVGTKFRKWVLTPSPADWVDISEITNIGGPDMSKDTIDVTNLDSTDGYREFIASFKDPGSVSLTMHYTREGYELMKDDFESDDLQNYEILLPDGTSLEFLGLVTELPLSITVDDKITMEVSIKISGKPILGSGGSDSPGS